MMKRCYKCGIEKRRDEFHRCTPRLDSRNKDGLQDACKSCKKIIGKNVDKIKKRLHSYEWKKSNPERSKEISLAWYNRNKEQQRERMRVWKKQNRGICDALGDKRLRRVKQQTPKWANTFFIQEIYSIAKLRTKVTGIKWHVDHIVPLKNPLVCGLHCENNLRVIPATVNLSKKNKHIFIDG